MQPRSQLKSPARERGGRGHLIPPDFIQQLLERTDCVEIVGRQVQLKKAGHDFLGLCPFHNEKSPSFTVSPTKQFYHCFGCGENGDAIRFIEKTQGLSFRDAVEDLARQVGMRLPETQAESPAAARARNEAARLRAQSLDAHKVAVRHYCDALSATPRALAYLQQRRLPLELLQQRYLIGYAPAHWDSLRQAFPDYERSPGLLASGLVVQDEESGRRHDRFRDRITFGIRNLKGEVVGFGGRLLGDGKPKYLNSPESPSFDKSRELFGLFEARQAIQATGCSVLVEGYMDVVALAGAGFGQAVATMGTACTPEHLRLLLRLAPSVVFCFDGDLAGRKAAWKAMQTALPLADDQHEFRFLLVPAELGKDPDDVIKSHGAEAFSRLLAQALPLSQYITQTMSERHNGLASLEDRARFIAEVEKLLARMPASRFGRMLREHLSALGQPPAAPAAARAAAETPSAAGPAAGASPVVPRVTQRPALPQWTTSAAARSIAALAQAVAAQPATAQAAAESLVAQLDQVQQQAFFEGRLDALDATERPLWQALHHACQLPAAQDTPGDAAAAQRDLLHAAPQALARARAQHRKHLLVTGLRQGAMQPMEFARAATGEPAAAPADADAGRSDIAASQAVPAP